MLGGYIFTGQLASVIAHWPIFILYLWQLRRT